MAYITIKKQHQPFTKLTTQFNFEDLLTNEEIELPPTPINKSLVIPTTTFQLDVTSNKYHNLTRKYPIEAMRNQLATFAQNYKGIPKEYDTFYIPKHSGGMRRIDAPQPELMSALTTIKNSFEQNFYVLTHNAAHAYVQKRSTVTAMQVHQNNNSKWFLKLDFKDFFPSHNLDYILLRAKEIFPFSAILTNPQAEENFKEVIMMGLLDNALPQGTPLSPLLTNILMVPVDYQIQQTIQNFPITRMVYTRYADDIIISSPYHFKYKDLERNIENVLHNMQTPFKLNNEKTRYGSSAGRNWNLGIMLNKDNKLTIGHKQNQRFRAAIFNFATDLQNNRNWSIMDAQILLGQISYYRAIEPEYINTVINRYSQKFGLNIELALKRTIIEPR